MSTMLRLLLHLSLLAALLAPRLGAAQSAPERRNWFDDPFFQIASSVPNCPEPAGPRITEAERLPQTHHRAERGTTCWLAGQCDRPNSYAYDADIAAALRAKLAQASNPFAAATLWVTVQGRVVYLEGCVPDPAMEAALERFAGAIPNVQQAIAAVFVNDGTARPPYRLLNAP